MGNAIPFVARIRLTDGRTAKQFFRRLALYLNDIDETTSVLLKRIEVAANLLNWNPNDVMTMEQDLYEIASRARLLKEMIELKEDDGE